MASLETVAQKKCVLLFCQGPNHRAFTFPNLPVSCFLFLCWVQISLEVRLTPPPNPIKSKKNGGGRVLFGRGGGGFLFVGQTSFFSPRETPHAPCGSRNLAEDEELFAESVPGGGAALAELDRQRATVDFLTKRGPPKRRKGEGGAARRWLDLAVGQNL